MKVSRRSHAWLRSAFWDRAPDAFVANVSARYEDAARQVGGVRGMEVWRGRAVPQSSAGGRGLPLPAAPWRPAQACLPTLPLSCPLSARCQCLPLCALDRGGPGALEGRHHKGGGRAGRRLLGRRTVGSAGRHGGRRRGMLLHKPWSASPRPRLHPWPPALLPSYPLTTHSRLQDLLESAAQLYDVCDGDMLRFQVVNGSLWVHHITDRRAGWYPAVLGKGNVAAKGRVPYAILALLKTLRLFPGQVWRAGWGQGPGVLPRPVPGRLPRRPLSPQPAPPPTCPNAPLPPAPTRCPTWTLCCTPPTSPASSGRGTMAAARRCRCWGCRGLCGTATCPSQTTPFGAMNISSCRWGVAGAGWRVAWLAGRSGPADHGRPGRMGA